MKAKKVMEKKKGAMKAKKALKVIQKKAAIKAMKVMKKEAGTKALKVMQKKVTMKALKAMQTKIRDLKLAIAVKIPWKVMKKKAAMKAMKVMKKKGAMKAMKAMKKKTKGLFKCLMYRRCWDHATKAYKAACRAHTRMHFHKNRPNYWDHQTPGSKMESKYLKNMMNNLVAKMHIVVDKMDPGPDSDSD